MILMDFYVEQYYTCCLFCRLCPFAVLGPHVSVCGMRVYSRMNYSKRELYVTAHIDMDERVSLHPKIDVSVCSKPISAISYHLSSKCVRRISPFDQTTMDDIDPAGK